MLLLLFCIVASAEIINNSNQTFLESVLFEFHHLDHRTADPCSKHLRLESTDPTQRDCQTISAPMNTVLFPSRRCPHPLTNELVLLQHPVFFFGRGFQEYFAQGAAPLPVADGNLLIGLAHPGSTCGAGIDPSTAGRLSVMSDTKMGFNPPLSWLAETLELEDGRLICIGRGDVALPELAPWVYSGFRAATVCHCDPTDDTMRQCSTPSFNSVFNELSTEQLRVLSARGTCCSSQLGMKVGQCILSTADNPSGAPTACCGGARINVATDRCCNSVSEWVTNMSRPCPCWKHLQGCPVGEACCLPTKYAEFSNVTDTVGECYNPNHQQCCDTGSVYDPGMKQCCSINGLQSLDTPCPCGRDTDCSGGQSTGKFEHFRCCTQVNARPLADEHCTIYQNFPSGSGTAAAQQCFGGCVDPSFQICCNGVACVKEYEKCCNSTCCNRFTQTCEAALLSPGHASNWNGFLVKTEVCSSIEQMTPHVALWLFVYPAIMLLIAFLGTGMVLVFANKASSRSYAAIESAMIYVAVLAILFSLVHFFSVAWKYSLLILFVMLVCVLTAAARIRKLNIVCVALLVLLAAFLFDPFHGNHFLNFASGRTATDQPDRDTAGFLYTIEKMYPSGQRVQEEGYCTGYYLGYGRLDPGLRDVDRFDNPAIHTFGYCSRGYVALLLIFAAIAMLFVLIQLVLAVLALVLRFTTPVVKLVAQQVPHNDAASYAAPNPMY
eukprot:NODE_392_length_2305_cov_354.889348_g363_i0.p1 GENE.NODE_392_length_2305_cov_354.889348_g363_i0~~NODE_392_length_2305_cov_354.889348_g363_i0.p1  ORF type:complete len:721 (-),score=182.62 NODE_392_length_2305_cov_354.889348_g363_i0:87-2249(-)